MGYNERESDISVQTLSSHTNHTPTPDLSNFRFPPQPDEDGVLSISTSPVSRPATPFESYADEAGSAADPWRPRRHSDVRAQTRRDNPSVATSTSTDARHSYGGPASLLPPVEIERNPHLLQRPQVSGRRPSISSAATPSSVPSSARRGSHSGAHRLHYQPAIYYPPQIAPGYRGYATNSQQQFMDPVNPVVPGHSGAFSTFAAFQQLPTYGVVQGPFVDNRPDFVRLANHEPRPLVAPPPTPVLADVSTNVPCGARVLVQLIMQTSATYGPTLPLTGPQLSLSAPSNFVADPVGMARADAMAGQKFQEESFKGSLESIPELCTQLRHRQVRVTMARTKLAELEAASNASPAPPMNERYAREYTRFLGETNGVFEAVAKGKENYPAKALAALGVSLAVVNQEHAARLRTTQLWQEIQMWREVLHQNEQRAYEVRLALEQARQRLSSLEPGEARKARGFVAGL